MIVQKYLYPWHANRPKSTFMQIWTIGHSTCSFEEFLALLQRFEIKQLADVRSFPGWRKFPQFNSENLADALFASWADDAKLIPTRKMLAGVISVFALMRITWKRRNSQLELND